MEFRQALKEVVRFLRKYWIASAIVVIFVILVTAWVAGYRVSSGLTVVRVGTIQIVDLPPGAAVYVDQAARGVAATRTMELPVVPGTHSVIVSVQDANPWETITTVAASKTTVVDPIIIPLHPTVAPLSASDTAVAQRVLATYILPTAANPLPIGCASVSVRNNEVIADATTTPGCTPPPYLCSNGSCGPTIIFSPIKQIQSVAVYPGRTDALLVSADGSLYGIGLDPRSPQAFAEILTAPNLKMVSVDGQTLLRNASGWFGLNI